MTRTLPSALRNEIHNIESAKAWLDALIANDMVWHLDDDPSDIIEWSAGEPLFAPEDVPLIRARVAALRAQEWGDHYECPIGYILEQTNY